MVLIADKPLQTNPNIVFREEEDGAFLFDPNTGELKCLNPMGGLIWLYCDGSMPLGSIERKIIEKYPQTSQDAIKSELHDFLDNLLELGYLGYREQESV